MASQPNEVKVLSKNDQKKSFKGFRKKKLVVKNTLESPFSLEWPNMSKSCYDSIQKLLRKSCSGLKPMSKPPWKEVQKFQKEERKQFLEEYKKHFIENGDQEALQRKQEREEAVSHLIFGYNAVMRALERDQIAGILVKKNTSPDFVVKTFLPGCANKNIPLVALTDLDLILKNEKTLGLSHACMVVGLKPSVKENSCRFNSLYTKMCEAVGLNISDLQEEFESEEELDDSEGDDMEVDDKENTQTPQAQNILTEELIQSYYLKRSSRKERIFTPGREMKVQRTEATGLGSDFISIATDVDLPKDTKPQQLVNRKPKKHFKKTVREIELKDPPQVLPADSKDPPKVLSEVKDLDSESMFIIDDIGDEMEQEELEEQVELTDVEKELGIRVELPKAMLKEENKSNKEAIAGGKCKSERSKKAKPKKLHEKPKHHPYISATKKRIKNNPNRKKV